MYGRCSIYGTMKATRTIFKFSLLQFHLNPEQEYQSGIMCGLKRILKSVSFSSRSKRFFPLWFPKTLVLISLNMLLDEKLRLGQEGNGKFCPMFCIFPSE